MSTFCPISQTKVTYMTCQDCKECYGQRSLRPKSQEETDKKISDDLSKKKSKNE